MADQNRRYALDPYRRGSPEDYPGEDRGGWFRRFRGGYNRDTSIYGRGRDSGYGRGGEDLPDRFGSERTYYGYGEERPPRRGYEGPADYAAYERDVGYGPSSQYAGPEWEERGMWDRTSDEVSPWFGDEDVERRREMDYRGRGPRGYTRSSERIREDVCDRLTDDSWVDASNIEVDVSGTEVTLSGTVESRPQRRRAEDCAESVSGVTHVQNNLRVAERNLSSVGTRAASRDHQSGTSTSASDTTGNPRTTTSRWT